MSEPFEREASLSLRILTPERVLVEASANWVQVPTVDGLLGIWPLHIALVDIVVAGNIEYESADGVHREWVAGGILHIRQGQVVILTGASEEIPADLTGLQQWEESISTIEQAMGQLEEGAESAAGRGGAG